MKDWKDEILSFDGELSEFAEDLPQFGDEPDLDDATQDKYAGIDTDQSFLAGRRERSYIDLRQVQDAKAHLTALPADNHTHHMIIGGRYPLFALVPAVLELATPATIDELVLVTLSYGKDNAADLLELLDAGRIRKVWLLVSHYFAHANAHLYDPLSAALQSRGHKVRALRTHAKIILLKLSDGRKFVVESSANLRSCKNIEQAAFTRCDGLFDFHRQWILPLFDQEAKS